MSTISFTKRATLIQPNLFFTVVQRWLLVFVGLMACVILPATAQPAKGSVYRDFLPMGSGASVALPEGVWEATQVTTIDYPGSNWEVYTLKNQQPDAKVPFLIVRQTTTVGRWGNTNCLSNAPNQFMVSEHGTTSSQTLNKCSRMFAFNFDSWRTLSWADQNAKKWWSGALEGLPEKLGRSRPSVFQVELTVQQFNGKNLRIDAFVLPPKGMTAVKFRDDFKTGQVLAEHQILSGWTSIYIESMQQSYFNKKPQPIMALAYPVNTGEQLAAAPEPLVVAAPRIESETSKPVQSTALLPAVALAPANQASPSASKPTPAAVVPPASVPAPAVVVDNSAQLKLEQERRAMDEEKRKMAQQLEAMTQMLAKLQQENAAAVAAAKAKEVAAATPEPPAKPSQPVTYANRKALVIGNDLYTHVPKLNNAGADAEAMAKSLEAVGYKVFKHLNLDEKKFKQAIRDFRQNLSGGDEVLFFYAGHGVQLGNANYLLPTDVQGDQEDQVKDDAILLQKVLDDLEEKKTKFALAVIDACRDNPFKSKGRAIGGRGLAPTSAATGQMIMFSAGSGQQALDRLGDNDKEKNGLFTRIFVKEMVKPGLSVDRVLRNVRNEVVRLARTVGHEQTPALYDQAIGEFYFRQ
ncbi:caspase family protein [Limnohabitans sp. Hippo3]|uniref:caspase family protein n=1 Tax=Limnohabitans sp. Hippo3 TaxID=1597956 RepID=UPI000D338DD4|nr:caspase family protein [Limnohabitans sp. Hippo3]PUE36982.1 hypothetical protein B9Z34_13585 [Limnohabitans sp. Hippo3]